MTGPAEALRGGLALTEWNLQDLWIAVFALGCNLSSQGVGDILDGRQSPTAHEYDLLSLALNEHLSDGGFNRPVMSWNELAVDQA